MTGRRLGGEMVLFVMESSFGMKSSIKAQKAFEVAQLLDPIGAYLNAVHWSTNKSAAKDALIPFNVIARSAMAAKAEADRFNSINLKHSTYSHQEIKAKMAEMVKNTEEYLAFEEVVAFNEAFQGLCGFPMAKIEKWIDQLGNSVSLLDRQQTWPTVNAIATISMFTLAKNILMVLVDIGIFLFLPWVFRKRRPPFVICYGVVMLASILWLLSAWGAVESTILGSVFELGELRTRSKPAQFGENKWSDLWRKMIHISRQKQTGDLAMSLFESQDPARSTGSFDPIRLDFAQSRVIIDLFGVSEATVSASEAHATPESVYKHAAADLAKSVSTRLSNFYDSKLQIKAHRVLQRWIDLLEKWDIGRHLDKLGKITRIAAEIRIKSKRTFRTADWLAFIYASNIIYTTPGKVSRAYFASIKDSFSETIAQLKQVDKALLRIKDAAELVAEFKEHAPNVLMRGLAGMMDGEGIGYRVERLFDIVMRHISEIDFYFVMYAILAMFLLLTLANRAF